MTTKVQAKSTNGISLRTATKTLRELPESWDELLKGLNDFFPGGVVSSTDLGDGFQPWDGEIDDLIGVPFIILGYQELTSDKYFDFQGEPSKYAFIRFMTPLKNGKFFIATGASGLRKQLNEFFEGQEDQWSGLMCRNGLTRSEFRLENGTQAHTYYISTLPVKEDAPEPTLPF